MFKPDVPGRLHTVISQMPRALRSYLLLSGCGDLVSIDLKTAQPFLLLPVPRELSVDEASIQSFYSALQGDLYTHLGRAMWDDYDVSSRDAVKAKMMFCLFSRPNWAHKIKDAVEELSPGIAEVIAAGNWALGGSGFAKGIQQLESDLVVKLVGNELRKAAIPVLTVHDYIIVRRQDQSLASEILRRVGVAYTGFVPGISFRNSESAQCHWCHSSTRSSSCTTARSNKL